MLFTFNNFWKTVFIVVAVWALYGLWGYEFTVISVLAAILGTVSTKKDTWP